MEHKISKYNWIFGILCGVLIGAGAILPGVSGGVLCMVFGYYQPLMEMLTHPKRNFSRYWTMFLPLIVGWPLGFFVFAKGLSLFFGASEAASCWLFIGLIVGTFPSLWREAGKEGRGKPAYAAMVVPFLVLFTGLFYMKHMANIQVQPSFGAYLFCGILFGASIVIPGLTTSSILMSMDLYRPLMDGAARLDSSILLGLLPGMVLAVALLARMVSYLFRTHYSLAYHAVLGVVVASTLVIIPTAYSGWGEVFLSAGCFAGGFGVAYLLDWLEVKQKTDVTKE